MRILFITRTYSVSKGGMERLSYELIQAVKNYKAQPIEISVLVYRGHRALAPLFNVFVALKAVRFARLADAVHVGDPMLSWVGWLIKKTLHKPVAISVHGLDVVYPNLIYQSYLRLFFNHFRLYICISDQVQEILKERKVSGQIMVINPGVTDRYYDPQISRQELSNVAAGLSPEKIVLLTVGRLIARKGVAWFIANVLQYLPEKVVYVIAGKGPEVRNIKQVIKLYGMEERVFMLSHVSDEVLRILYNTVDAFIQPNIAVSNDVEGFGLVLLEAALCKRPVFAAAIDGIPSAIRSGQNGMLLKAENKAVWIAALKEYIQSPTSSSRARDYTLENFNWERKAHEFVSAISSLADKA